MRAGRVKAELRPPWCGNRACDRTTRMVETGDERLPERCPCLRAHTTYTELVTRRERLRLELDELNRAIAAAQTPEWARGPGDNR
jgi:hypothetical protein